ncbi:hypothetical protein L5515_017541 [Caenorhabditis briggsae]|uniref:Uncharacterized protein n=2 Tax=Caenorhabditis briggsae TaxID=6238 RepID=A0AAE9FFP6_CAEBR|nr:hypothetical protein L5515_017541 [Caenorhabditis briggsae]
MKSSWKSPYTVIHRLRPFYYSKQTIVVNPKLLLMEDALKEAVNDHFAAITTEFEENRSVLSVLHQAVMEGSGLMYPSNYEFNEENENAGEEAKHNAEIQKQKKEKEIEIAEEVVEKATVKSIVLLMDSDGWFFEEDDDDEESNDD